MIDCKIVIGSQYGDEGKGLMTDYFAAKAIENNKKCMVVCHNGGAQRGHTVVLPNGIRHIFHHFGSGTLVGADTYLSSEFIVNPMVFRKEYNQLIAIGVTPKCYINPNCRVSLPYDMMINQIAENSRGENRHGSCGMGIWETIVRHDSGITSRVLDLKRDFYPLEDLLHSVHDQYLPQRLQEIGVKSISIEALQLINNSNINKNYMDDVAFMMDKIEIADNEILLRYDSVIFEGGQGLLLDQKINAIHSTPSKTGIFNPMSIIQNISHGQKIEIEACYVSRTYLTKHGAGEFKEECPKDLINPRIVDMTNIPNEYQGEIRYGELTREGLDDMTYRIVDDFESSYLWARKHDIKFVGSLAFTHINECQPIHTPLEMSFDRHYYSDGMTRSSICLK